MKRVLALPAALLLALMAAGAVGAWPPGSLSVETNGCSYTLHITQETPGAVVAWEVRTYAATPFEGDLINSGSGTLDASARLDVGPFTAAAGQYNAIFGFDVVTNDTDTVQFTLSCEASSPTATPTVAPTARPTPTEAPTPTPTETPSGGQGSTTGGGVGSTTGGGVGSTTGGGVGFTGGVGGLTVTPPPTDTGQAAESASGSAVLPWIALVATLVAAMALALPARFLRRFDSVERKGR